ncbi:MAG: DUF4157 domain-containing protein [Dehalococcoidia bacterium]|nr:DUF4157 domain-containing protein [Dehalococcoidia bacterium]MCA9825444.1 DUF4157 domain-containing protein [Dehalococcoidia bacterium]MCA9844639.1 DUF4157 domain-containing protein [Dehalococcoidia bacterium]MCA9852498.1 DUF4157 domain-containing protein [Dehalococcoidia bacterium]
MSTPLDEMVIEQLSQFVERRYLARMRVIDDGPGRFLPVVLGTGAVTIGSRVFFRRGRYDPFSARGLALIAHESMHIQQYDELGVPRFFAKYVIGILQSGLRHDNHPMERTLVRRQKEIRRALLAG